MRAVAMTDQRPVLELVELPDPEPGEGEALIRVTGCGICGSDLHVASAVAAPGMVLGHEIAGVVEALGPGAAELGAKVGETVAVRPFAGCGHCPSCSRGRADHCDEFQLLGLARPGGFAELTTARAGELFRLPAAVTGVEQALVEPLAVAHRAVVRGGVRPTDSVAILGAGPIGQAVLAWVRQLGVERIVVTDPAPARRRLALDLGATAAIDPIGDELGMLELALSGADVVFECAGRPGMVNQAMDLAAVDGRVVVVGVCLSDDVTFPYTGLRKELDVRYALYYERADFTDTIDALSAHRLRLDGYVGDTVELADLPARFAELVAGADGGKVVLTP
ncbi:MAG: alcohol dehydrogenase catalytic domain-containing protein [Acidimicrobiales bacterium]|nr:alcohol dehydrogenase catalytic domain-containing protein [Acidimicrobiales bacterium]